MDWGEPGVFILQLCGGALRHSICVYSGFSIFGLKAGAGVECITDGLKISSLLRFCTWRFMGSYKWGYKSLLIAPLINSHEPPSKVSDGLAIFGPIARGLPD